MGGGVSGLYQNTIGSRYIKDLTNSLFVGEPDNEYSTVKQGSGTSQGEFVSNSNSGLFTEEINHDKSTIYCLTLFIVMFYFLKEKFKDVKNKKMLNFLHQINEIITFEKDSLMNSSEFKKFQNYCKSKNIHQFFGYEIIRRFMTKRFSDSSGIFMKLRRDEWVHFANQFSKKL